MTADEGVAGHREITVISWRDIPAQVTAVSEGDKETTVLSDRFQHAIDRAAAIAGFTETNAYLAEMASQYAPSLRVRR